ncbi:MAG TPA: type II toxin-antitoxin system VapC family toxin [Conexibacter sp.]|nr:type II toxin-antitoxin system VapC family toxin [Conexibacter sp.]
MITAVDTNVLLDVVFGDARFGAPSRTSLRRAFMQGALIASEVVWAETVASFPSEEQAVEVLDRLRVRFVSSNAEVASAAGAAWRGYRRDGGPRARMLGDFLVGAHARVHADRLLTRDRRFYGARFRGLTIFDPAAG